MKANRDKWLGTVPTTYEGGPVTVARYADRWLVAKAESLEAGTMRNYEPTVRVWIRPHLGHLAMTDLTADHLRALSRAMYDAGKRRGGVEGAFRVIRVMLNSAVADGVIDRLPMRRIDDVIVRAPTREAEAVGGAAFLTAGEIRRVLAYVREHHPHLEARWALGLLVGMRQSEVLGLCWEDVDLGSRRAIVHQQSHVERGKHGCGDRLDPTTWPCGRVYSHHCPQRIPPVYFMHWKTKRATRAREGRIVALPTPVVSALATQRDRQRAAQTDTWTGFVDGRTGEVYDLVCGDPVTGAPLTRDMDSRLWRKILIGCGIEPIRVHDARHTSASLALAAGISDGLVQQSHGWASRSMLDRYQHVEAEAHDRAAAMIDAALGVDGETA